MRRSDNRQGAGAARDGIGVPRARSRDRHRPVLDRVEDGRGGQARAGLPIGRSGFTTATLLGGRVAPTPRGDTSLLSGRARLTAFVPFMWFLASIGVAEASSHRDQEAVELGLPAGGPFPAS